MSMIFSEHVKVATRELCLTSEYPTSLLVA